MDLVSLLITFIGVLVLLGLYIMSRFYDESPSKQSSKNIKIPTYTDANGNELSSVKADFPAQVANQSRPLNRVRQVSKQDSVSASSESAMPSKNQHVLFIASEVDQPLSGNKIIEAMKANDLKLGLNDIYHFYVDDKKSLFSIANGVEPWTLKDEDLKDKATPGLSMIMQMPTVIDKEEAIDQFVAVGKNLAKAIGGELQNTQQQIFLQTDKEAMLAG